MSVTAALAITTTLPFLPEKFIVDFVNGLEVADEHIRLQRSRTKFFDRLCDDFSGVAHRRQTEVNANLATGLRSTLTWLNDLTESLAKSDLAIAQVNKRIGELYCNIAEVVNFAADSKALFDEFALRVAGRFRELEQQVAQVDLEQKAGRHLEQVFDKWAAGGYGVFSPLGRLYVAMDELYWGDFGTLCRTRHDVTRKRLLEQLVHKAVYRLNKDAGLEQTSQRMPLVHWLEYPREGDGEARDALAYLGDWADSDGHPMCHVVTQSPAILGYRVPRVFLPERAVTAMQREFFEER